jgi:hypothetical protein
VEKIPAGFKRRHGLGRTSYQTAKIFGCRRRLLNANIISRELGLADKQIVEAAAPKMVVAPPEGSNPVQPTIAGE